MLRDARPGAAPAAGVCRIRSVEPARLGLQRYEPKLKDADAILRRFDYWLGVHKGERYLMANGSRLFNKKELAEALGVARPTLDRWITNGWLEPCRVQISNSGDTLFSANAVREVLERFR